MLVLAPRGSGIVSRETQTSQAACHLFDRVTAERHSGTSLTKRGRLVLSPPFISGVSTVNTSPQFRPGPLGSIPFQLHDLEDEILQIAG